MKKAIYRVYTNEMEGEYTEGYIELTAEELENLSCRDSDYEYEEVIVSKDLGYLKLYREVIKNNTERLKKEEEYKQWLEDNPKERERLEKRDKKRSELIKFMGEDIEEVMFNQLSKLSRK